MDTISADISFLFSGLKQIKKEIEIVGDLIKLNEELRNNNVIYYSKLIDFCESAIEEMDLITDSFENSKLEINVLFEKFGEKKNSGIKNVFTPMLNFFKCFK